MLREKKKKRLHASLHITFVLSGTPTSLPGEGLLLQVLADRNWARQRTWFQNTSLHLQLLQCVSWSVISDSVTPRTVARQASVHGSPGKDTGVGSHSLLQGIFLTQGSNPGLLYCIQIVYHLSQQGRPQLLWDLTVFSYLNE